MAMIINLDDMNYKVALAIIKYCAENNIDTERALTYSEYISTKVPDDFKGPWELDIPESLVTYFILKCM